MQPLVMAWITPFFLPLPSRFTDGFLFRLIVSWPADLDTVSSDGAQLGNFSSKHKMASTPFRVE
ncbi:hypothetical protein D9756_011439 [Leucocoprinus leucothites]|uniref:Uncharacterized protein n=1 Tax=Leucocoprinus leucothites TaxID=201217 RepID=A0A8H5CLL1_9AGAR|nr:hypothetical protein D9756_011439 [Leucoagaricus leucothites]